MLEKRALRTEIARLTHPPVEGMFYRSIGAAALFALSPPQPLWSLGPGRSGQRFSPLGGPPALYVAAAPQTTLYEGNSLAATLFEGASARPSIPATVTISVRVRLEHVLDLTDKGVRRKLGLTSAELFCPWKELMLKGLEVPTHVLAEVTYEVPRLQGILFPSHQDTGGTNLIIWPRKVRSPYFVEVEDSSGMLWQRIPKTGTS
jgi:RES domain-containing protein